MSAQLLQFPKSDANTDFMALWSLWLGMKRGHGKKDAERAWLKAVRRAAPEVIIAAAERFTASQAGRDPQYIPHAATWLNGDRWDDQFELAAELKAQGQADFDQWCIDWVNKGRSLALRRADPDAFVRSQVKAGKINPDKAREAGYL